MFKAQNLLVLASADAPQWDGGTIVEEPVHCPQLKSLKENIQSALFSKY